MKIEATRKQWIQFAIVLMLWLAFLVWLKSWLGLVVVPFIFDAYITKIIPWTWWKKSKNETVRSVMSWVDAIVFAPGIHAIRYDSEADSITITHDAKNRKGFALGAVLAAEYTANHEGFLGMNDLFQF